MNKEKKIILTLVIVGSLLFLFILFPALIFFNQKSWDSNGKKIIEQGKNQESSQEAPEQAANESSTPTTGGTAVENNQGNPIIEQIRKDAEKLPKNIAEAYKNVDECAKISNAKEKDACIMLWAEYAKDKGLCEKASLGVRQECISRAMVAKAVNEKNLAVCAEISDEAYKRTCIYRIVIDQGLSSMDCRALSADDEKNCRLFAAVKDKKSAEECDSIGDEWIKGLCKESFYVNLEQQIQQ